MSETISSTARSPRRRPGGPRRWSAADKAAYLAAFATSRLSATAFCAETGVPRASFTLWQREAREARATRDPRARHHKPAFAAVEFVDPPATPGITMVVRSARGGETELTGLDAATAVTLVRVVIAATGVVSRRR